MASFLCVHFVVVFVRWRTLSALQLSKIQLLPFSTFVEVNETFTKLVGEYQNVVYEFAEFMVCFALEKAIRQRGQYHINKSVAARDPLGELRKTFQMCGLMIFLLDF